MSRKTAHPWAFRPRFRRYAFGWRSHAETGGYFKGTAACLSALLKAGRNDEMLRLLERAPHRFDVDRTKA